MNIHTVTVEFLRAGPRHNQLLSPLTPYLAVCGESPAGVVNLPFEHAEFERQREDLRYSVVSTKGTERREGMLHQTGREMAQILADVPGLPGALTVGWASSEILHLRIVVSASELALLPFELSKLPIKKGIQSESWLQLHANVPVCLTRHNRSVPSERVKWPTKPKILYISGPGTPHLEHLVALEQELKPWTNDGKNIDEWLCVRENATIEDIVSAIARDEFTHIHILAHGATLDGPADKSGVSLNGRVVSGQALAQALISVKAKIHTPTVVTLATCDSGYPGSVLHPDASVAHDLHEAGIPLVVASQFPFSLEGARLFVQTFYAEQLRGIHPLHTLYKIRMELSTKIGHRYHDWASLVVYEALPSNLAEQLFKVNYLQTKSVLEGTLKRLEKAAGQPAGVDFEQLDKELASARKQLPDAGPYEAECVGLRAASWKRRAQIEFVRAKDATDENVRRKFILSCHRYLDSARTDYGTAISAFLIIGDKPIQREATLHWLLSQVMALDAVLGEPFASEPWMASAYSARAEVSRPNSLWGHGTMAELYLIRLHDKKMGLDERQKVAADAIRHAEEIVRLNGLISEPVKSSCRQFERYVKWWGAKPFQEMMLEHFEIPLKTHWDEQYGLLATAKKIVKILGGGLGVHETVQESAMAAAAGTGSQTPVMQAPVHEVRLGILSSQPPETSQAVFDVELLPAENGDCLWLEYGDPQSPRRLIIDCGAKSAAHLLLRRIQKMSAEQQTFEMFVLTHIDADHISGVPTFFAKLPENITFKEIWFNGWKQIPHDMLGVRQAEEFSQLLAGERWRGCWNQHFGSDGSEPRAVEMPDSGDLPSFVIAGEMRVTVLSPGHVQLQDLARKWLDGLLELHPEQSEKELLAGAPPPNVADLKNFDVEWLANRPSPRDPSAANGSSIALLFEFEGSAILLTGDAHADVLAASIRRLLAQRGVKNGKLKLDAFKLSHHGSKNALTKELLDLIDCRRYLVSTNGARFYHPDREAIARVLIYGGRKPTLYFNYVSKFNEMWGNPILTERFGHSAVYPSGNEVGLRVRLKQPAIPQPLAFQRDESTI